MLYWCYFCSLLPIHTLCLVTPQSTLTLFVHQAKERSQPCPLVHGQTLTLGSTTLTLHIHTGWETCAWCDPARGAWQGLHTGVDPRNLEPSLELDSQRKRELNRMKKKYGLSVSFCSTLFKFFFFLNPISSFFFFVYLFFFLFSNLYFSLSFLS